MDDMSSLSQNYIKNILKIPKKLDAIPRKYDVPCSVLSYINYNVEIADQYSVHLGPTPLYILHVYNYCH